MPAFVSVFLASVALLATGCVMTTATPQEPVYQPSYLYAAAPPATGPVDVTVGLVAPQFEGDGAAFWEASQADTTVTGLVSGLRMGFRELLVSTGFNVTGPFDSIDIMTYPEKRTADLVVYPVIDFASVAQVAITDQSTRVNVGSAMLGGGDSVNTTYACDVTVRADGAIQLVAMEPMSEQLMWVRRIDIAVDPETVSTEGPSCEGRVDGDRAVMNAWARLHERIFESAMTSLDAYVDAEEFVELKAQAQELRDATRY